MKFIAVGINHEMMSIEERENFYFSDSDKFSLSLTLKKYVDAIYILSTCNRSEVYVISDDAFDEKTLETLYLNYFHSNSELYTYINKDAITHLLEVTCGINSMILGEDQIYHQVKQAYQWTLDHQFSNKEMNYIIQTVMSFSKKMKNQHPINNRPMSISYIAYSLIKDQLKDDDAIMIVGIGEISSLMIKYLSHYSIYLVNRSYEKVVPYLNDHVHYIPFEERYHYIKDVQYIISATSSPHTIFDIESFPSDHECILIDLALPRDIDIRLKDYDLIELINMDDLYAISNKEYHKREEISDIIKKECIEESEIIYQELLSMKNDEVIRKLQESYLDLSNNTYNLLIHKIDLNKREKYILKKVLNASFLSLLKDPIELIKSEDKYLELYEALYKEKEE